jgi:hypothetical protein
MTTYNEHLQRLYHRFMREHEGLPAGTREVVEWGVKNGLIEPPEPDPLQLLSRDMARALREEYRTDPEGRRYRVNHSATITAGGVQISMWGELDRSPREHMHAAFGQRRKQVVGDCLQLKTDVDVYNSLHPKSPPIQVVMDFTDDVAEIEAAKAARKNNKKAA